MFTAIGIFRRVGINPGPKFAATFDIDNVQFTLGGIFVSGMPHFSCRHTKLTYTSLSQLTSTRLIEGSIGPNGLMLRLINGPTIEGILEWQLEAPTVQLIGCGIWFQT